MSLNTVSKPFSRIDKVPLFYFKSTPVNQPFKPIKRAPNIFESSSILIKTKHPFAEKIKKPLSELEKQACEIRGILNKLSVHNFDKLCKSLVNNFDYDEVFIKKLAGFLFERAVGMSFSELFAKLCGCLKTGFKKLNFSNFFCKVILNMCEECFYKQEIMIGENEFKRKKGL